MLSKTPPIHLIDAGNTCLKLYEVPALSPGGETSVWVRQLFSWPATDTETVSSLCSTLHHLGVVHPIWVSSRPINVQQQMLHVLTTAGISVQHLDRHCLLNCLPQWDYNTEQLGLDRMLNILGAQGYFSEVIHGLVLIQAGTATCVEFIQPGRYCGGWIQPGFQMGYQGFIEAAPHLLIPNINQLAATTPKTSFPLPHNTATALHMGMTRPYLLGLSATIEAAIREGFPERPFESWGMITTGGAASTLRDLGLMQTIPFEDLGHVPELTVHGVLKSLISSKSADCNHS
jgi:pantothenate kinase type III